jgi:hypothetical protein
MYRLHGMFPFKTVVYSEGAVVSGRRLGNTSKSGSFVSSAPGDHRATTL